jgi:SpoIID/LytB domain protein
MRNSNTLNLFLSAILLAGLSAAHPAYCQADIRIGLAHTKQVEIRCDGPMRARIEGKTGQTKELPAGTYSVSVVETPEFFRAAPLVAGVVSAPPQEIIAVSAFSQPDSSWKVELLRTDSDKSARRAESDARTKLSGQIHAFDQEGLHVLETGPFPNEYLARQAADKARRLGFPAKIVAPGEPSGYAELASPAPASGPRKTRRLIPKGQPAPPMEERQPSQVISPVEPKAPSKAPAKNGNGELEPLNLIPEELLEIEPLPTLPPQDLALPPAPAKVEPIPETEKGHLGPDLGWIPAPGKSNAPSHVESPAGGLPKPPPHVRHPAPALAPGEPLKMMPPKSGSSEARTLPPPPAQQPLHASAGRPRTHRPSFAPPRPNQRPMPPPAKMPQMEEPKPAMKIAPAPPPDEAPALAGPQLPEIRSREPALPPQPKPAPPPKLKARPEPKAPSFATAPKKRSFVPNVIKSLPIIRRFWWEDPIAGPPPEPDATDLENGLERALKSPVETAQRGKRLPGERLPEPGFEAPPPDQLAYSGVPPTPMPFNPDEARERSLQGEPEPFTQPIESREPPKIEPFEKPSRATLPKESETTPVLEMDDGFAPSHPSTEESGGTTPSMASSKEGMEETRTTHRAASSAGGKTLFVRPTKPVAQAYVQIFDENGKAVTDPANVIDIEPLTSSHLEYNKNSFHGNFQFFAPSEEWLVLVNETTLEDYVAGIVPQEIPAESPFEVLKAQAVMSRCYALQLVESGQYAQNGYDIPGDPQSEWPYSGRDKETPNARLAVEETGGEVLIDSKGGLATPVYCFSSGGYVADAKSIWGGGGEAVPSYLKARPDYDPSEVGFDIGPDGFSQDETLIEEWLKSPPNTFDREAAGEYFRWKKTYTNEEMDALANDYWNNQVGSVKSITITQRAISGHATEMEITGTEQTVHARDADTIREALQLDSSLIVVKSSWTPGGGWTLYGGGLGHGVGLSQSGAMGLVKKKGANYKQILHFYFDELKLGRRSLARSSEGA